MTLPEAARAGAALDPELVYRTFAYAVPDYRPDAGARAGGGIVISVAALEATTPALDPAAVFTIPLAERERLARSGRLDPAAFRRDLVEHIREADPAVRAFADWRPSDIAGSRLPLVASVAYKDTIDVAGYATRLGITSGYRCFPRASADIASRLKRAGLACVGKVATTECALGSVLPSRNPRFPHVSAGGSSSGSAAAVAAGFCDVSVGTDSGGSLRWPAIYCGATALRLTPRPALLRGVHAVAPSMESVGFVTRSAADLAWLWRRYRLAERLALAPAPRRSSSLRLCFSTPAGEPLHAEVDALLRAVGDALDDHGHAVVGAPLHDVWERRADAWELLAREAYDSYGPLLRDPDIALQAGHAGRDRGRRRRRRRPPRGAAPGGRRPPARAWPPPCATTTTCSCCRWRPGWPTVRTACPRRPSRRPPSRRATSR